MDVIWSVPWMVSGFLITCAASQGQLTHPQLRAEQVPITSSLCGGILDVGKPDGNWKRLFFPPGQTCRRKFNCKVTFRLTETLPLARDICVDFSRIQIHGSKNILDILRITNGSQAERMNRLNSKKYRQQQEYFFGVICVNKQYDIQLKFRANCDQPLNESFVSWMYVYLQSTATGDIYFLDGTSKLMHQIFTDSQERITLRSHVWSDVPRNLTQQSTFQLSVVAAFLNESEVCIEWNPFVSPTVPAGVRFKIVKKYYSNNDSMLSTVLTMEEGEVIKSPTGVQSCYRVGEIYGELTFEVSRNTNVAVDPSWSETQLLFDLTAGVNNYGDTVYTTHSGKKYSSDTTTDSGGSSVDLSDYNQEGEEEAFSWSSLLSEHGWKIGLGAGGVILIIIICCCCCNRCKRKGGRGNTDTTVMENTRHNIIQGDNTVRQPDAIPMMPRLTPSAPYLDETDENLEDVANDNAREHDLPAYSNLFPD